MTIPEHVKRILKERGADPHSISIITTREEYKGFARQYGLPNQLPKDDGTPTFGKGYAMFVGDDQDGKPVVVVLVPLSE